MKPILICLLVIFFLSPRALVAQTAPNYRRLAATHDLDLGAWGPYSKRYAGISHVADLRSGLRLDFSLMAATADHSVLPELLRRSAVHPWQASSDLRDYQFRYELRWQDSLYLQPRYQVTGANTVRVTAECVNRTGKPQRLAIRLFSQLAYPEHYPRLTVLRDPQSRWLNAVDYQALRFHTPRPKDNLPDDGWQRAEIRGSEFADGSAIGDGFGQESGDRVTYQVKDLKAGYGQVTIIFRGAAGKHCSYKLGGLTNGVLQLQGTGNLEMQSFAYHLAPGARPMLTLTSLGGDAFQLNGLVFSPAGNRRTVRLASRQQATRPEYIRKMTAHGQLLKYRDVPVWYGVAWRSPLASDSGLVIPAAVTDTVPLQALVAGELKLAPGEQRAVSFVIFTGSLDEVRRQLRRPAFGPVKAARAAEIILPGGNQFLFSQQLLKATLLTNVVYPIYTQRRYIRHFTPGKWWNSLYTWDSGFTTLGLTEVDLNKAIEVLNTYTTRPGEQPAFIHHGSMVPVQVYNLLELWNRTQSVALLRYFYPQLRRYYRFMSGRDGSSTNNLQSGLLRPWDYFYNSGGWDDYPPQLGLRKTHDEARITPVITTAQCIRAAKILRLAAVALGAEADIRFYDEDIRRFTSALQRTAWNDSAGYFSYVMHDTAGRPTGPYRHSSGQDFNQGLDGAYPLHAGICSPDQEQLLIGKLFSPKHLWTPAGLGVVDQSAAYYNPRGYWNGAVWMPHQWFMWKTLLDLGRPDEAYRLAARALEVYERETRADYNTYEHFRASDGAGAGWHQFAGLSTPVLAWFSSYYRPGTVTSGLEIWLNSRSFRRGNTGFQASLRFDAATAPHRRVLLVCLDPVYRYRVTFAGRPVTTNCRYPGLLEITLPATNQGGRLSVSRL